MVGEFIECSVISVFCFHLRAFVCAHACIKSCQLQNTYEEAGESYI